MKTKKKSIEGLWCNALDVKPRDFDFGAGFCENWEIVYPNIDEWSEEQCCNWLDDFGYEDKGGNPSETVRNRMLGSENYCPMMNYIYPLPDLRHDPANAQEIIENTSCVIVLIEDDCDKYSKTPYLALAGGGMDLSWDICEAYMLLGYLPPVHFCRLPDFAGKKLDETAQWIIDGCKKSCKVFSIWQKNQLKDLQTLQEQMRKIES